MTVIAWINKETNNCDNVTLDPRPASEIHVDGYLMLDLDEIGGGGVDYKWDGTKLFKPQPEIGEQPVSDGTQTL